MSVTGEPGGTPVKCGIPIADLSAGLFAVNGILAALLARVHSGRGQYVETSLYEASLALSVWETTEYWATGRAAEAMGSAHRLNAPYQAFRTADGYINVAALTPAQWVALCAVLGAPDLVDDPRYRDNAMRLANRHGAGAPRSRPLSRRSPPRCGSSACWPRACRPGRSSTSNRRSPIRTPHARHMIEPVEHPAAGRVRTLGFPVKFSDTPMRVRRPPPQLGEHSDGDPAAKPAWRTS